MALGISRPRNWGKEAQSSALALLQAQRRVTYRVTPRSGRAAGFQRQQLWLAPSHAGLTLPFREVAAELVHVARGRWEARHCWDDRVLATGVSQTDVIRAAIAVLWH